MLAVTMLALVLAVSRSATVAAHTSQNAPADEYFGNLHMSAIAIRLRIDLLGRRYAERTESDDDLLHDASDVEAALNLWTQRYPHDIWAAPTAFHLAQLFEAIQTEGARARARAAFARVASAYPASHDGHLARLRLATGFPPLHPESPVVASPAPDATPAVPIASSSPSTGAPASPVASPVP